MAQVLDFVLTGVYVTSVVFALAVASGYELGSLQVTLFHLCHKHEEDVSRPLVDHSLGALKGFLDRCFNSKCLQSYVIATFP